MIESLRNAFRALFVIVIVLFVIGCIIAGGVIGNAISSGWAAIGVILGLIVGVLMSIIGGGFIATIIYIDINIEEQNNLLRNFLQGISSSNKPEQKCKKCHKTSRGYSSCPHCGASDFGEGTSSEENSGVNNWNCSKCGKANRYNSMFCTNCGEKK